MSFSIEIRAASSRLELATYDAEDHANLEDGAAVVLVNGEVVAIGNEYGTAKLVAGTNAVPTQDAVELFITASMDFYEAALANAHEHDGGAQVRRIQEGKQR